MYEHERGVSKLQSARKTPEFPLDKIKVPGFRLFACGCTDCLLLADWLLPAVRCDVTKGRVSCVACSFRCSLVFKRKGEETDTRSVPQWRRIIRGSSTRRRDGERGEKRREKNVFNTRCSCRRLCVYALARDIHDCCSHWRCISLSRIL